MRGGVLSGRIAGRRVFLVTMLFAVVWANAAQAQVDIAPKVMPVGARAVDEPQLMASKRESVATESTAVLPDSYETHDAAVGVWDSVIAGSACPSCGRLRRYWQPLPDGLIYRSYLAGAREPRIGTTWFHEDGRGWLWDSTLGGRVGLMRYGTDDELFPEGWQFDAEGAAFPRLNLEEGRELDAVDFRAGAALTFRSGMFESKFAYYHLSSHLGDEFLERIPGSQRRNYSRDALVLGAALRPTPDVRFYAETGWAFYTSGGSEPWEFQFGIDFSPAAPTGCCGAPFMAVNAHLREEVDFGGNLSAQAGWQWRGQGSGRLLRLGAHYFNGKSVQFQFFDEHEEQIGLGLWYDY